MGIMKGLLSSDPRSVFITTNVMDYGEVYSIQHYVIKFVRDKSVVYSTYSKSCCKNTDPAMQLIYCSNWC